MIIADKKFIKSITDAVIGLAGAQQVTTSEKAKKYFEKSLSELWNELGNKGMQINSTMYSINAEKEFMQIKEKYPTILKKVDTLDELYWKQVHSSSKKGSNRFYALNEYKKRLRWEHGFTRGDFVREVLNIYENDDNIRPKLENLIKEHQIVWITEKEDERLNEKYKSKRGGANWINIYKKLGIKLKN
ncbi:hypothetical protein [Limosilactobacillus reuteri]|uniref:hypothetical protein n=1 Tax=Limosilactobacillus reuteri TaxID=1598 RepID=UPI001043F679|nr:hypothetical protein [Limosilactobacillus reuteri]